MLKRVIKIVGILVVLVIGSCVAAIPIEDRRIGGFCASVTVGSDKEQVLNRARAMFGVQIRDSDDTYFFVKSIFTFKTLCLVKTENSHVTDASFVND